MKNKKLVSGLVVMALVTTTVGATFANSGEVIDNLKNPDFKMFNKNFGGMRGIRGIDLSDEEREKLDSMTKEEKNEYFNEKFGEMKDFGDFNHGFKGMKVDLRWIEGKKGFNLTEEEQAEFDSMTDEEKKEFIASKSEEAKTKRELEENVIDKLLAGESLTSEEETARKELLEKRTTEKQNRELYNSIIEKKNNGETLTSDEEATLESFKSQKGGKRFGGKGGGW